MEYYDRYDEGYIKALNSSEIVYKTMIKVLNWQEQIIEDLTHKCDLTASSLNINLAKGVRRSGTLCFVNDDESLDINENKLLWAMRKWQIFKGVESGNDTYWFSLGIFLTSGINGTKDYPVVSIADKYSVLNGDIKLGLTEAQLQIPSSGSLELLDSKSIKFISVVRDLLQQPIGNGYILDSKEPVCDPEFDDMRLQKQIVINEGFYPGQVIEEISQTAMYNAYYDTYGRLRIVRDLSDDYYYLAPIFDFDNTNSSRPESNYAFNEAYNAQTVEGSDVDGRVYRYTAVNDNPRSPIRVSLIGERRDKKVNIANGDSERKCEMYANYLLKRKTAAKMTVSFETVVIPHIDVDKPIIKDGSTYIVQSANFALAGGSMRISACPIEYIPFEQQ